MSQQICCGIFILAVVYGDFKSPISVVQDTLRNIPNSIYTIMFCKKKQDSNNSTKTIAPIAKVIIFR